jgi:putative ABC transport system permease protein
MPTTHPGARIPLALRNLTENPLRLAASVAGVAFAVVLMFLQNGFRNALLDNMVAVITHLDGDLFITSRSRYILSQPVPFPLRRLELVGAVPSVVSVHPFYLLTDPNVRWRNTRTGSTRPIRLLAYRPADDLLAIPDVRGQLDALKRPDVALVDSRSKAGIFGPMAPGDVSELAGRRIEIVGTFPLGTDFRSNGTLLTSEANLLRYVPSRRGASLGDTMIDVGVIRLAEGAESRMIQQIAAARLTPDVLVLTRDELLRKEQGFWSRVTPIGVIFDIGLVTGFVVGLAICYQVLASEIFDRISQFATLKAIGYTQRDLSGIVVNQALILALMGFVVGLLISLGLFHWLQRLTGLNMRLKPADAALILALTLSMCVASALLVGRKLRAVDPAELFG